MDCLYEASQQSPAFRKPLTRYVTTNQIAFSRAFETSRHQTKDILWKSLTQVIWQDCTFVMLCWPPNSHSRDEQFLLSSRVITGCLRLLHRINQWLSTFSLKGAKSRLTTLL